MNQLKKAILFIVGCICIVALTIVSCNKIPAASPPPIITGTTGIVSSGSIITINGNNFTSIGTSVTINATPVLVTYISPVAIMVTVPFPLAASYNLVAYAGGLTSNTYQAGGFTVTSDSVDVNNLIAHWSFDQTAAEAISGATPATTGTTAFVTGQIGHAISFTNAFLVYPTISKLNYDTAFINGFTVTMWAKLPLLPNLTSLWQLNGNTGNSWGLAALATRVNANDTLDFDGTLTNLDAAGTHTSDSIGFEQGVGRGLGISTAAWEFLTMSYDTTAKELRYYGNGNLLSISASLDSSLFPHAEPFKLVTTAHSASSVNSVSFGSFDIIAAYGANAGNTGLTGQSANLPAGTYIDDTRIFNTTLSTAQIDSLYVLGVAGK